MEPAVSAYLAQHQDRFLEELCTLLRIPSVSADPAFLPAMQQAAEFVRDQFAQLGMQTEIVPTAGHPIVYAEWLGRPGAPTVLVYGHYDVQPPDPLDLWTTPPFEPTIRDGKVYARGATDDKGQFFTHVKAAEAWLKATGALPVNLKFVIEGEEEVGSHSLHQFLNCWQSRLACDVVVISDSSQYAPGIPAITYGLRGIISCEATISGPNKDLHSGIFGGAVANPAVGATRLVASLHDSKGRILIPGFYDDVRPLAAAERSAWSNLPFDEVAFLKQLGLSAPFGEEGYTTIERRWARPTCEINGLVSGYTGVGPKTIIPSSATIKITCRLVPDQDPQVLAEELKRHWESHLLPGLSMTFNFFHGSRAVAFDTDSPAMRAAQRAIASAFGTPPVLIREGGSIPIVVEFRELLGPDCLLLGWGYDTDNLHSPNEHFSLNAFRQGISASAVLYHELCQTTSVGNC